MPTTRPAHAAAKRSTLSARQWADLRRAARLARSEDVYLVMHGVKVSAAADSPRAAGGRRQGHTGAPTPVPDKEEVQPTEADGSATPASKKKLRDARRLQEYQGRKRAKRWLTLVLPVLHIIRRNLRNDTWTAWMRSRVGSTQQRARPRLRNLLWLEWTRPQFGSSDDKASALGLRSYRDEYILRRARAFSQHIPELQADSASKAEMKELVSEGFTIDGVDPDDLQEALLLSLVTDSHARDPGENRQVTTRSRAVAEADPTPASAPRHRKKRGGR